MRGAPNAPTVEERVSATREAEVEHSSILNEEGTRYKLYEQIRSTYDGPLSMATDMMVWNITKEKITERMAVSTDEAWPVLGKGVQPPPQNCSVHYPMEYLCLNYRL